MDVSQITKHLRDTTKKYVKKNYVTHEFIKGRSVRRLMFTEEFYDFLIFSANVFVRIFDIKLLQNKHIKIIEKLEISGQFVLLKARRLIEPQ